MGSIDPKDLPIESTFYYNERSALFIYTVLFDAYNIKNLNKQKYNFLYMAIHSSHLHTLN